MYLLAQCDKSKKPFIHFLTEKKDMKTALDELIAHVEISMMESIDFDGTKPKVMRITTDRESTLTSKVAAAKYLQQRRKIIYTASGACLFPEYIVHVYFIDAPLKGPE